MSESSVWIASMLSWAFFLVVCGLSGTTRYITFISAEKMEDQCDVTRGRGKKVFSCCFDLFLTISFIHSKVYLIVKYFKYPIWGNTNTFVYTLWCNKYQSKSTHNLRVMVRCHVYLFTSKVYLLFMNWFDEEEENTL